jgi:hypothetical protein
VVDASGCKKEVKETETNVHRRSKACTSAAGVGCAHSIFCGCSVIIDALFCSYFGEASYNGIMEPYEKKVPGKFQPPEKPTRHQGTQFLTNPTKKNRFNLGNGNFFLFGVVYFL